MTIDPQSVKLAKDFEPILLFHRDEKFSPIDPTTPPLTGRAVCTAGCPTP